MGRVTNGEFGRKVGVSESMASRIRSGQRLPSAAVLHKIHTEYGIPLDSLMRARDTGAEQFGLLVRSRLETLAPAA